MCGCSVYTSSVLAGTDVRVKAGAVAVVKCPQHADPWRNGIPVED